MRIQNKSYIFAFIILLFIVLGTAVNGENFFMKVWKNWDANVWSSQPVNDEWQVVWDLIVEDSRSIAYKSWKRWNIEGLIHSDLYGEFSINSIELSFLSKTPTQAGCADSLEVYKVSWEVTSVFWGKMRIKNNSYFCSNQYTYLHFESDTLGSKEIWEHGQVASGDVFWKQEIAISWIAKLDKTKDTSDSILTRGDDNIEDIYIDDSVQTYIKRDINKNIFKIINEFKAKGKIISSSFNYHSNFNSISSQEKVYVYDYSAKSQTIKLNGREYINKWKNLQIWSTPEWITKVNGKHVVIVNEWNLFINSNIDNWDDTKDLLVLIAKRWTTGKGWNIYIHPDVTNIDAVMIADGSLLSLKWDKLQDISNISMKNNLRKQLLIYGSILSSNTVGSDSIPYGADYYEKSDYVPVELTNIYDLWNLRTFNLDLWKTGKTCEDGTKLSPINGYWDFLTYAWAGKKRCYITDGVDAWLRQSDKTNPLIVEFNPNISKLKLKILQINK